MKNKRYVLLFFTIIFSLSWGITWRIVDNIKKVKGVSTNLSISEIISLTNLNRIKNDIPALNPNQKLNNAAKEKAQHMIDNEYFNHVDANGNGPWIFINNQNYHYHHAGENLARNFTSAEKVISAWMTSEEHKNNILSTSYSDIGVAVLETNKDVLIVQLLASKIPDDLINQIDSNKKNFTFTKPLTNQVKKLNPNIIITITSFLITIVFIVSTTSLWKVIKQHQKNLEQPDIRFWKKK
ncbi:CAP domain-containing protein [Patescibacteria group bacterium]